MTAIIPVEENEDKKYLVMATKRGIIKKTKLEEYQNIRKTGLAAITLREGDELIEVKQAGDEDDIFMVTREGQCIRFASGNVREIGRVSIGVIGINLGDADEVVAMQVSSEGEDLLIVSEKGMGKRTPLSEFTLQNRGGKGLRCYRITEKTGYVVGAKIVNADEEIMMITTEGIVIRMESGTISVIGRNTSGVKLMDIDADSDVKVASVTKVKLTESEAEENEHAEDEADSNPAEASEETNETV